MDGDTIFALSSGAPPAAVAVMRVSGPGAGAVLEALAGSVPPARRASLRTLRDGAGALLDQALVLWLPGPASATGEDMAELHLHGGRATIAAVSAALRAVGLRDAVAGEFTRRALANGRIDMAQAEGLADLLAAETAEQRRLALAATEGRVSAALGDWYDRLVAAAALIEARLDHADEDDVVVDSAEIVRLVEGVEGEMAAALAQPAVERLRDGVTVVLTGPPNAGKSSLFNALVEREAAIVTAVPGTTRDVIEAIVTRNDRIYRLLDTAGLRDTENAVEQIGVERAIAASATADIALWLGDEPLAGTALWINARCDLPGRAHPRAGAVNVSVDQPATIVNLWQAIEEQADTILPRTAAYLLSERQHRGVTDVVDNLAEFSTTNDDLVASEILRRSCQALDRILGRHAPEAMLDALFRRFCIGK